MTILCVELEGIHTMGEYNLNTTSTVTSQVLSCITKIVHETHGVMLHANGHKYVVSWNAFKAVHGHETVGCDAALQIAEEVIPLVKELVDEEIHVSMFVTTARMAVGYVGDEKRKTIGVFSTKLRDAEGPLCSLNKVLGTNILISAATRDAVGDNYNMRVVDYVCIDSVHEPLYELCPDAIPPLFNEAISCLRMCQYDVSTTKLAQYLTELGDEFDPQALRVWRISQFLEREADTQMEENKEEAGEEEETELPEEQRASEDTDNDPSPSLNSTVKISPRGWEDRLPTEIKCEDRHESWRRSEKIIGKGMQGEVWLGIGDDGKFVAVKFVRIPKGGAASTEVKQAAQETVMLSRLRHENIVGYVYGTVMNQRIVSIMEYVSAGSLEAIAESFDNVLSRTFVRRALRDILRGLAFLHQNGVVHRDIKPANVLMSADGVCKLSDFGTCLVAKEQNLVDGMTLHGSPVFMSPEACRGETVSSASDIWSLGVTAHKLLTGEFPYASNVTAYFLISRLRTGEGGFGPVCLEREGSAIHGDSLAVSFLAACWAREGSDRWTAEELLAHPYLM